MDIDLRERLMSELDGHVFSHTVNQSSIEKFLNRLEYFKEWLGQKIENWFNGKS